MKPVKVLWDLQSFTWVSWGYLLSADISCRPQFRRFLASFLCYYVFSKLNIYFFILVFLGPVLFCLFLFRILLSLCSTFDLSPQSVFAYHLLSLSPSVTFFVCLVLFFLLSSIFLLWFSLFIIHFLFLILSLSLSSTFLLGFLLPSFFACLLFYSPDSSVYLFVFYYYHYRILLFCIF